MKIRSHQEEKSTLFIRHLVVGEVFEFVDEPGNFYLTTSQSEGRLVAVALNMYGPKVQGMLLLSPHYGGENSGRPLRVYPDATLVLGTPVTQPE